MKRILAIILCFVVQISTFCNLAFAHSGSFTSNYSNSEKNLFRTDSVASADNNIGILSTSVWAEQSIVRFGNKIKVHYRFDDEPHTVKIEVYLNGSWLRDYYDSSGNLSSVFEYNAIEEGSYKFIVEPIDASDFGGECSVTVYKDRVIFIPGIMGTDLYVDNVKAWIPNKNLELLNNIKKLAMKENGVSEYDAVEPREPVADFYESISLFLSKQNYHVVNFGYDWRMDITENAKSLKQRIDKERAASPYSKIYIVAHSMGGLVASEYIKQGNASSIDKLITIGTPYLGAPKATFIFETGYASGVPYQDIIIHNAIKSIMPNIISAYQLLPSENYFTYNNSRYLTTEKIDDSFSWTKTSSFKRTKLNTYSESMNFLNKRDWANNGLIYKVMQSPKDQNILSTLNSVDSYFIIGDQVPTPGGVVIPEYRQGAVSDIESIQGDGTVPLISATVGSKLDQNKSYYIKEEHSELPGNTSVQQQVANILKGSPEQLAPNIRKISKPTKALKLKIECPVELNVYDAAGNHTGPTGTDTYETTIPYGEYYSDGETKFAFLEEGDYNVRLKGTGYGEMIYSLTWSNEDDIEEKTVRFDEINVTPSSVFTSGTSKEGQIILEVDANGDGVIDQTLSPSVELDLDGTQDETIPTLTSHIDGVKGVNEWYGVGVYYNLIGQDDSSGVYKTYYDLNESNIQEYSQPIALPDTGIYYFKSFVRDKNRNDSEIHTETVKVDTTNPTKPTMTIVPLKWTNQFVSITLSNSQDADSGFQKYQYKIGKDGEWKDYIDPIIIDTEGLYNVYARAVDNVFNLSEEVVGDAKVDKTRPSTPSGFETHLRNYNEIKISWMPSTDNVEVTGYDIYLDTVYLDTITDTEYIFSNLTLNTTYKFKIIARDEAGNFSDDGIYYDKTPLSLIGSANHTIYVKADGSVWTWGSNTSGQLGDGTITNKTTAVKVEGLEQVVSGAAGGNYSLALKSDGTVWAWGDNAYGQLGTGNTTSTLRPVQVPELRGVIAIASSGYNGSYSSYALKSDGTVWAWGLNNIGQLGDGTTSTRTSPVQVTGLNGVSAIASGLNFTLALKSDGTVWGWGAGSNYQFGNGSANRTTPGIITGLSGITRIAAGLSHGLALKNDGTVWHWGTADRAIGTPTKVAGLSGVTAVGAGNGSSLAVMDGKVWAWGYNATGQLGDGTTTSRTVPVRVSGLTEVSAVAGGMYFSAVSKADGSIWTWGENNKGQLGDGTVTRQLTPVQMQENRAPVVSLTYPLGMEASPSVTNVEYPSILWEQNDAALTVFTRYQVQVLSATGEVVADSGEVSQSVTVNSGTWTVNGALPSSQALQVRVRVRDESVWSDWTPVGWLKVGVTQTATSLSLGSHGIYVKADGSVWTWGSNTSGQLGDGTITNKTTAVKVEGLEQVVSGAAGGNYSLALKSDGTVWAWGDNAYGQLGTGNTTSTLRPVQVPELRGVIAIASSGYNGSYSSYALKSDGTVWAWGLNNIGQLGDGTTSTRTSPVQVTGLNGVSAIASGLNFTLALKSDGTVWGWGAGSNYQFGNGSANRTTPGIITGLSGITRIAAGLSHGLALKNDGTVWHWGTADRAIGTPTKVAGLSGVTAVGAGNGSSLAVMDGKVWAWGYNATGQLGDGTTTSRTVPVRVSGLTEVSAVAGGMYFSAVSKADGSIWTWGENNKGQLGDGTVTRQLTPVQMQENRAPVVSLTYPLGMEASPSVTNVEYPSILWEQNDAALTVFTRYQVQVLSATGEVVADSGEVSQSVTVNSGTWTVNGALPSSQALQVRVRVRDESVWSDWTPVGWLKVGVTQTATSLSLGSHGIYVKADGSVWTWGSNTSGQLGDGTITNKTTAVKVEGLEQVVSGAAGGNYSLALKSDGTVWAWGDNAYGQLGTGNTTSTLRPVQVPELRGVIAIASSGYNGSYSSYALKSDGTVWAWGLNNIGQLGDGTTSTRTSPVQVTGLNGVSAIASGLNFTLALKSDGTVWGWGAGSNYQFGNGSANRTTPGIITGLSGITRIAAGLSHGLALKNDGTVWHWGTADRAIGTPTKVAGLSGVTAVGAGNGSSLAVMDGKVWAWGYNATGQLGDGTTTSRTVPVRVSGLTEVSAVAGGMYFSAVSKADGSIWTWGENNKGQLGDGTVTRQLTPVQMQENRAPVVSLTYPLGMEASPSVTNVEYPSILWEQNDAALTVFTRYQVQVLSATGEVVADSGEVSQSVTVNSGTWTVNGALPSSQALQVRVRVRDESVWSDWTNTGWINYLGSTLNSLPKQLIVSTGNEHGIKINKEATVTLSVYGPDNSVDTSFTGLQKIELLGYLFSAEGSPGRIGSTNLSTTGATVVDIEFKDGVATIPFIFFSNGKQILSFRLIETNVIGIVEVDVQRDLDQSAEEKAEEKPTEEQQIMEPIIEPPTEKSPFDEELVMDNSPNDLQVYFNTLPTYVNDQGEFDVSPLLAVVDHLGNPAVGRSIKVILSRGEGQLVGNTVVLTNESGYAIFSNLMIENTGGDFELTFILDDEITQESIQVIYLRKKELSEEVTE